MSSVEFVYALRSAFSQIVPLTPQIDSVTFDFSLLFSFFRHCLFITLSTNISSQLNQETNLMKETREKRRQYSTQVNYNLLLNLLVTLNYCQLLFYKKFTSNCYLILSVSLPNRVELDVTCLVVHQFRHMSHQNHSCHLNQQ